MPDILIAVTASDEMNLLCCLIAREKQDSARWIFARVRDPLYSKEIGFIGISGDQHDHRSGTTAYRRFRGFSVSLSAIKIKVARER